MRRLLIIEDDKEKIKRLLEFQGQHDIVVKESFQAGVSELKNNHKIYDFLILDMTIPLWEKGNNDLGGNYEQFGGEKVLREMKRRKLYTPTILFTMFDVFPTQDGNITFGKVDTLFKKEFSDFYIGAVLFSSEDDSWMEELSKLMGE
ncbi:response regulator receiver protein [Sphingobacterium allocomposti]|uniref:Response regulator receiver protein n=1 Tax=Sphingobacterium allocomposti TaxID=415956 RepID=A0A5S5DI92_9SPHI|nr:response regulator transcription factor [Sphingobacterium composti Yoo et al. 2007 non Ten et al. 2007]TYP94402.1 response regulator receiver protein [Sphingobacterium composti Yoo et al. 2007 non Ten et al. 2007]